MLLITPTHSYLHHLFVVFFAYCVYLLAYHIELFLGQDSLSCELPAPRFLLGLRVYVNIKSREEPMN